MTDGDNAGAPASPDEVEAAAKQARASLERLRALDPEGLAELESRLKREAEEVDEEPKYWTGIAPWEIEADPGDDIVWADGVGWVTAAEAKRYGGAADTISYTLHLRLDEDGAWTATPDALGGCNSDELSASGLSAQGVAAWVESYGCPVSLLLDGLREADEAELMGLARQIEEGITRGLRHRPDQAT